MDLHVLRHSLDLLSQRRHCSSSKQPQSESLPSACGAGLQPAALRASMLCELDCHNSIKSCSDTPTPLPPLMNNPD